MTNAHPYALAMNTPSRVSISDMPAAKMIGSAMIASGGSPPAIAVVPAIAMSPTWLAVSKPSPNSSPTGYICQDSLMNLLYRPLKMRFMKPRWASSPSSSSTE